MININCVYDENYENIEKFLNTKKDLDYINYFEIYTKLEKNDIYSKKPSDIIISTYIYKQFEKLLIEKNSKDIFYVLKNVDDEVFENLGNFIKEFTNDKIKINLYTYIKRARIKKITQIIIDETQNV